MPLKVRSVFSAMFDKIKNTTVLTNVNMPENVTNLLNIRHEIPPTQLGSLLIAVFYILVMVIAIPGNILILWITLANKKMRSAVHILVCNLAISGLLIAVLRMPIKVSQLFNPFQRYLHDLNICRMTQIIPGSCVTSISLTLTTICIDRYNTIIHPTRTNLKLTVRKVSIFIPLCWVASILFWIPYTSFLTVYELDNGSIVCAPSWPRDHRLDIFGNITGENRIINIPYSKMIVWILFITLVFLIPASTMIILYSIIANKLWRSVPGQGWTQFSTRKMSVRSRFSLPSNSIRSKVSFSKSNDRRDTSSAIGRGLQMKRRVMKIFITCLALFMITNMPYYCIFVLLDFQVILIADRSLLNTIANLLIVLNYTCIAYNAIIYGYFNKNFRKNAPRWLNASGRNFKSTRIHNIADTSNL